MKKWLALFSQRRISGAAVILILIGIVRLLIGLVAQAAIAFRFGATRITDAYFVSFITPQIVGDFLVGGAIFVALIPVFIDYRSREGEKEAWKIASVFVALAAIFLAVCSLIYLFFAPFIIRCIAPGFTQAAQNITVIMARILSPLFLLFGMSLVAASMLQSYRRFAASALATLAFPCGIIFGCVCLYPVLNSYSLPVGALIGAFFQCALQWCVLRGMKAEFRFSLDFNHPAIRKLFRMTTHIALAVALGGFILIFQRYLASRKEGLVAALSYAQSLGRLPVAFFIAPFFVAIFPSLSALSSKENREEFSRLSSLAIRIINFLALPSTFLLIIFRVDIIKIILMRGEFGVEALGLTQEALLYLAFGFCALANIGILARAFYAIHDTLTNLILKVLSTICAIPMNIVLFAKMGIGGLALASSITYFIILGGFLYRYNKKIGSLDFRGIALSFIKTLLASSVMAVVCYIVSRFLVHLHFPSEFIRLCISVGTASAAGIFVFVVVVLLFRMEEIHRIMDFIPFLRTRLEKVGS